MKKNNRILTYSHFSYIVWWKKGYQQFQEPRGTSVIKIKGIAKVSGNNTERYIRMLKEIFYLKKRQVLVIKERIPDIYGIQRNIKFLQLYVK
jgi:hypothetical protein